jgi:1-acyl-sn-glycerol-3-phosphate acyltransferase
VIAGNNIINAFFMVLASITAILLLRVLTIPQLFLTVALMNAVVAVYIYTLVPEFLMRFLVWMLIHVVYRVRKEGLEYLPEEGAAVLVCNHVSYVDALVIAGCCPRPVRFIMYHGIYKLPVLNFVFRTAGAIPIAPAREDQALHDEAFRRIDAYLADGELVCIFPEGGLTRDGELQAFRPGIETIIARNPVPVIPMALQGLWGSFFSRRHGIAMKVLPRRFWSRIGLRIGEPLAPTEVSLAGLQGAVASLRGDWQ